MMDLRDSIGQLRLDWRLAIQIVGGFVLLTIIRFFSKLYRMRRWVREQARKYDIPMMPHHWFFGHMIVMGKIASQYPRDISPLIMGIFVAEAYPHIAAAGCFYLDRWPIMQPYICVMDPDMVAQFTQEVSLPHAKFTAPEWRPLTNNHDLVTSEGASWKRWRSAFNPGFSAKNIMALLPAFIEEISALKEIMVQVAKSGETVHFESLARAGTIDIICRSVVGIRMRSLAKANPFTPALDKVLALLTATNTPEDVGKKLWPLRAWDFWYYGRVMDNYLRPHVQRAFAEAASDWSPEGPKTVNYLAAKAYVKDLEASNGGKPITAADGATFAKIASSHLKMFLFAGHETTASTLCFVYSMLYARPEKLAKIRAEHDAVLGTDLNQTAKRLTDDSQLLNQLPYTSACIKETLRLWPPAGTARDGQPNFFLRHPETGKRFPTEGCFLFDCTFTYQRSPKFWPRASEFLPERWLAEEGDELFVSSKRGAYRPFESGPRNCIGQELAQVEIRAILAMTLRDFDIEPQWAEDGPVVLGEKGYPVFPNTTTSRMKDQFPVKIKLRQPTV